MNTASRHVLSLIDDYHQQALINQPADYYTVASTIDTAHDFLELSLEENQL